MGGVCTVVKNSLKPYTVKVQEGADDDEYLVTRIDNVKPAINIVNVYGGQESRMDKQDVLEAWGRLKKELDKIKEKDENCILLGDFNGAIGADNNGVPGNHEKVSFGGQLVRELLEDEEYVLLNSIPRAEGGPWTWVSRANPNIKSCIDLVIVSADLLQYVSSLVVDVKKEFSMFRVRKVKNQTKLIPSDHFPLVIRLKNLPTRRIKREQESHWNLNKEDGWKRFKDLQSTVKEKMDNIIANQYLTINEVDKKIDMIQTKIKFQSFGKTKPMTENFKRRRLEHGQRPSQGMDDEEERKNEILKKQNDFIEDSINKIKSKKFGRKVNVFKMKDIISGSKKPKQEAHAIVDPNTGEKVVSIEEIKRVNLKHCIKVLKHNTPSKEAESLMDIESKLHKTIMEDDIDSDTTITKDDFDEILKKFTEKTKGFMISQPKLEKISKIRYISSVKECLKKNVFLQGLQKQHCTTYGNGKGVGKILITIATYT